MQTRRKRQYSNNINCELHNPIEKRNGGKRERNTHTQAHTQKFRIGVVYSFRGRLGKRSHARVRSHFIQKMSTRNMNNLALLYMQEMCLRRVNCMLHFLWSDMCNAFGTPAPRLTTNSNVCSYTYRSTTQEHLDKLEMEFTTPPIHIYQQRLETSSKRILVVCCARSVSSNQWIAFYSVFCTKSTDMAGMQPHVMLCLRLREPLHGSQWNFEFTNGKFDQLVSVAPSILPRSVDVHDRLRVAPEPVDTSPIQGARVWNLPLSTSHVLHIIALERHEPLWGHYTIFDDLCAFNVHWNCAMSSRYPRPFYLPSAKTKINYFSAAELTTLRGMVDMIIRHPQEQRLLRSFYVVPNSSRSAACQSLHKYDMWLSLDVHQLQYRLPETQEFSFFRSSSVTATTMDTFSHVYLTNHVIQCLWNCISRTSSSEMHLFVSMDTEEQEQEQETWDCSWGHTTDNYNQTINLGVFPCKGLISTAGAAAASTPPTSSQDDDDDTWSTTEDTDGD
jgi:hypothetical protein